MNIGALANLAWLKKPSVSGDLPLDKLVALCAVAMRPSERTWERFLHHLEELNTSQRLSEDEISAVISSSLADQSLRGAELVRGDEEDFDSGTLDEVIERVSTDYRVGFESNIREVVEEYERKMSRERAAAHERVRIANIAASKSAGELERRDRQLDTRAGKLARRVSGVLYLVIASLVVLGSAATVVNYAFRGGWIGVISGGAVLVVMALEFLGVLRHLQLARNTLQDRMKRMFVKWLKGGPDSTEATSD